MDETAARQVLLVRAAEGNEAASALLSEDDRRYAGRAAAELVRWRAADRGERAVGDAFVAKRAELLAAKLAERTPRIGRVLSALRWRPWIGFALPALAFASGLVVERVADPGRVNILAFPLLGIITWNLAVYVWALVRTLHAIASRSRRRPGWLAQLLAGARRNLTAPATGPAAGALASFALDWGQRSAPLVAARAARILHLSAAALALGAVAGLFLRGLAFEYRAGWESTFLDAATVHALLAFLLAPATHLIGQPFPTLSEVAALRWDAGGGENAARWIYLYAVTVGSTVIVPRLLLAAAAGLTERRLCERFPLPLDDAYFRRLLSGWRESSARVQVVPYAYTPAQESAQGLQRLAVSLFGDNVQVHWSNRIAFGDEDVLGAPTFGNGPAAISPSHGSSSTLLPDGSHSTSGFHAGGATPVSDEAGSTSLPHAAGAPSLPSWEGGAKRAARGRGGPDRAAHPPHGREPAADLVVALFNLAATPETENHGVFLDRLRSRTPGAVAMIVDEGPYRKRLGAQAGADARVAERRQAWSGLAQTRTLRAVCVDLSQPELAAAQRELDALLTGRTASA